MQCTLDKFKPQRKWRQGEHVNGDFALHQTTREVVHACVNMYMVIMEQDSEIDSCAAAVTMLKDIVEMCGPYVFMVKHENSAQVSSGTGPGRLKGVDGGQRGSKRTQPVKRNLG